MQENPAPDVAALAALPSVDRLLQGPAASSLAEDYGRAALVRAIRAVLQSLRESRSVMQQEEILERAGERLVEEARPTLRRVFNLTGTVLHTNLGRAPLPEEAVRAMAEAAGAASLEYDVAAGRRGERDDHVERLLCELTGAEAATVVNNNAAAVLLVLNTLALRREVPVSRGELIEIGGAFRMPEIMSRAGAKLVEVGTTNRTHLRDYEAVLGPKTGLVLKVHTSNYVVQGFTAAPAARELAALCRARGVPFAEDLGSGTLVDLERYGLPHEPTVAESLDAGADLVTFSGDKLLGGPQAGVIAGRADLVEKLRRNPMKRALRLDKLTLAALAAVLRLYRDPDRLAARLPALRLLARPVEEIEALAARLQPLVARALGERHRVEVIACASEIGSGAQPMRTLASAGLAIRPGHARLAAAFRRLPVPVIGRLEEGAFVLDLRTLEDEAGFAAQLAGLAP